MGWKNLLGGRGGKVNASAFLQDFWWQKPGTDSQIVVNAVVHQCSGGLVEADAAYYCLRTIAESSGYPLSVLHWYHLGGLLGVRELAEVTVPEEDWRPLVATLKRAGAESWPEFVGDEARRSQVRDKMGYYSQFGDWDWKLLVVCRDSYMVNAAGANAAPKGLGGVLTELNAVLRKAHRLAPINGWGPEGRPHLWLDVSQQQFEEHD